MAHLARRQNADKREQKIITFSLSKSVSLLVNIYFTTITLAFICSLLSFRLHMGLHLKVLSIVLGLTVCHEYFSRFINGPVLHIHYNTHLYNVFALVEFSGFSYYYLLLAKNKIEKNIIRGFLLLFPVLWYVLVIRIYGILNWNSYMQLTGTFFIVVLSMYYYCKLLMADEIISLNKTPEFWIATGMIIFNSCNLPYFGSLNYLMHNYKTASITFLPVLLLLNIIMYSLFIYAYLCQYYFYKTTPKQLLPSGPQS